MENQYIDAGKDNYTTDISEFISGGQQGCPETQTTEAYQTDWLSTDDERRWNKYIRNPTLKPLLTRYITDPVRYQFNSSGYRSDKDFNTLATDQTPVDVYIGCSHTQGTGHHFHNTYPAIVSRATGNVCMNLGQYGTGVQNSLNNLLKVISSHNIQTVFHFQPIYGRWGYKESGEWKTLSMWSMHDAIQAGVLSQQYMIDNRMDLGAIALNHYKTVHAINSICAERNIPYFHTCGENLSKRVGIRPWNAYNLSSGTRMSSGALPGIERHDGKLSDMSWQEFILRAEFEKPFPESDVAARDLMHFPLSFIKLIAEDFVDRLHNTPGGNIDFRIKI